MERLHLTLLFGPFRLFAIAPLSIRITMSGVLNWSTYYYRGLSIQAFQHFPKQEDVLRFVRGLRCRFAPYFRQIFQFVTSSASLSFVIVCPVGKVHRLK
jgi:hypothetical protein